MTRLCLGCLFNLELGDRVSNWIGPGEVRVTKPLRGFAMHFYGLGRLTCLIDFSYFFSCFLDAEYMYSFFFFSACSLSGAIMFLILVSFINALAIIIKHKHLALCL